MSDLAIGKITLIFGLFLGACLLGTHFTHQDIKFTEDEDVIVLTEANYDIAISNFQYMLVEFYAPWCSHCKQLAPIYSQVAKIFKDKEPRVILAKIDGQAEANIAKRYNVGGYPTIKFIDNGKVFEYKGGRTEKDIVDWLEKRTGEPTLEVPDMNNLNVMKRDQEVFLVYYGESKEEKNYQSFKDASMDNDKLEFVHVFNDEVRQAEKAEIGSVVMYKKFEEMRNDLPAKSVSHLEIGKFIDKYSYPTVIPFTERSIEYTIQKGNPSIFFVGDNSNASQKGEEIFTKSAVAKKGQFIHAITKEDDGHEQFDKLTEFLGSKGRPLPMLFIISNKGGTLNKYLYEYKEITVENIDKFIQEFKKGKLKPYKKSEDIPESNPEAVIYLVGKTWEDIVMKGKQDVLVEFYAPWCGHCKQLSPKFESMAKKLAGNKNLIIAKIDSTANEITGLDVNSYPTLKFYPGNSKSKPVDYEGDKEEDKMISWLKDHVTHKWVEPSSTEL